MTSKLTRGSEWCRWEPHIHAPGTVMNNQFTGPSAWEDYLSALEAVTPAIEAIAVTDYYVADTYEQVLEYQKAGRLPLAKLIFPNVELRLDVASKKGFVNIHLLVCPDEPDHLDQLRRFLVRLSFRAFNDRFDCTRDELIRLGKQTDTSISDDRAALRAGATQFKVNFSELRDVYQEIAWAKENMLVAVAGGSGDGTSGVRGAADKTIREEIDKFADIIFASSPAQRDFWLGQGKASPSNIKFRFDGLKPCLHGSDAHKNDDVGEAHEDRFSWIKGGLTFDSLRQACIDPAGRTYVGPKPPITAIPSQVVDSIEIENADWLCTPMIELNPGLVTIVGARGSGKTALADMIAAGCDALPESIWSDDEDSISSSFLARAKPLIGDGRVKLKWGGGDEVVRALDGSDSDFSTSYPRARYLSQRFVEDLCSSTQGPSDGLIVEIERVIFNAHDDDSKDGAINFRELRDRKIDRFRQTRDREADSLAQVSQRIGEEHEKERLVPSLVRRLADKTKLIDGYRADLSKLVIKESEVEIKRHGVLTEAIQAKQTTIESFRNQKRSFETLRDEVTNMRASRAPEILREVQSRIQHSGFSTEQWEDFLLDFKGPVDDRLPNYIKWVDQQVAKIKGAPVVVPEDKSTLLAEDADLKDASLAILEYEIGRLEGLLKADKLVRDQFSALSKRIREEGREKEKLTKRLADAQGASERRKKLHRERGQTYQNIFSAVLAEEQALAELYGPLQQRLSASSGTLQKLQFSVYRVADAETWATFAEENLLDRRTGQLKGRGTLTDIAVSDLKPVWETGTAEAAKAAMDSFISDYHEALLSYAPIPREEEDAFRAWLGRFAHWLFSTDHISVRYGISYDGVDIANLSPGTRGIVLLLLSSHDQAMSSLEVFLQSGLPLEPMPPNTAPRPALHDVGTREPSEVFKTLAKPSHQIAAWTLNQLYLAMPNPDKNWAGDCQTSNFHTRLWEAQLLASFREQGLLVTQPYPSPDFRIENRKGGAAWVEAVTANPAVPYNHVNAPPSCQPAERDELFFGAAALRFAKTLGSKLQRSYHQLPHVKDMPFAIAIADFHAPASMIWSREALIGYLFGQGAEAREVDGMRVAVPTTASHLRGDTTFPAGLFSDARHEELSAVVFSNACSISKLSRVPISAGADTKGLRYMRIGNSFDRTSGALRGVPFCLDITSDEYRSLWPQGFEPWSAELEVFHNPHACHPLPKALVPEATHWIERDGETICEAFYETSILWSQSLIQKSEDRMPTLEDFKPDAELEN